MLSLVRHDFRHWICHWQDDGFFIHAGYHSLTDHIRSGYTDEDIASLHGIRKTSLQQPLVRQLSNLLLAGIHAFSSLIYTPLGIAQDNITEIHFQQQAGNRNTCRACTVNDDAQIPHVFACQLYRI